MKDKTVSPHIQGEGDYEAARRYDRAAADFAQSGKVAPAARKAKPLTAEEAAKMLKAEREGRSHAKGEDPAIEDPESGESEVKEPGAVPPAVEEPPALPPRNRP